MEISTRILALRKYLVKLEVKAINKSHNNIPEIIAKL
jgi:hypothetical protein